MITDIERLLLAVAERLDGLGLPYAVGGSVASTRYGEPRGTNDVDIALELPQARCEDFRRAFGDAWYVPEEALRQASREGGSFNVIHYAWVEKVDFFVAGQDAITRAMLARRRPLHLGGDAGRDVWFSSAEDIVLCKLDWERRSGGILTNQRRDVLGVLKLQAPVLDVTYLRRQAENLGLVQELERCLREAGVTPGPERA